MTPLQNLPRNVGDLAKLIFAKGFKKLLKVQKIAKSGHTGWKHKFYEFCAMIWGISCRQFCKKSADHKEGNTCSEVL